MIPKKNLSQVSVYDGGTTSPGTQAPTPTPAPAETPVVAPETTAPVENTIAGETPAVQEPVVQAAQPTVSGADLVAKWQASAPQVDATAMVNQQKQSLPDADEAKSDQMATLEQWKTTMLAQSNNQIDYNVAKAITELERAMEDAQPQYKEQQESITKDEMQSRDNAALYAEARGDKGGIGQEQYSSIMNTAAQNRLAVQQAQTKLATDTQRQIADLRAQGEFDKADAALEICQQYLSQLMSLEQWAFDAGMSAAQFKASIDQWAANYEMALAEFKTGVDQWNADFAFQKEQAEKELGLAWAKVNATGSKTVNALYRLSDAGVPAEMAEGWLVAEGFEPDEAKMIARAYKDMQVDTGTDSDADAPVQPYNEAYFRQAMSGLVTLLAQGNRTNAVGGIDSIWAKLSRDQRNEVRAILAEYGLAYEEEQ